MVVSRDFGWKYHVMTDKSASLFAFVVSFPYHYGVDLKFKLQLLNLSYSILNSQYDVKIWGKNTG